jgi:hypothetical protein
MVHVSGKYVVVSTWRKIISVVILVLLDDY